VKPRSRLLSAVGVATAALALAVCFVVKPVTNATAPPVPSRAPPDAAPPAEPGKPGNAAGSARVAAPLASGPAPARETNALGIRPEFLEAAARQAAEMAAHLEEYQSAAGDAAYAHQAVQTGNPSRQLALRLGLDAETARVVDAVLSAELAKQVRQRVEAAKRRMERQAQWLARDREGYENHLALESMIARGEPLTREQREFAEKFRRILEPAEDAVAPIASWYENPGLLAAASRQLSAAQRTALAACVEELRRRDREVQALHVATRSDVIASQLGLDAVDRAALEGYLREHPAATRAEIAAIVAPELRELLPEGI
jgi:hypothetical protein